MNLKALDAEHFDRSNHDSRFKAAIAVDPAFARAYVQESLSNISVPTHIINLGQPGHIMGGVEGQRIVRPKAGYERIPDATHFSFLGECKPDGPAILKAEGDLDPLCEDGGRRPRAEIHAQLARTIAAFFERHLKVRP